jgi:multicomponent Na+:H+ antiporter subunit B
VLIYASTGLVSFLFDDNYLNYNSIAKTPWVNHPLTGQHIGIFFIEIGVGLTVSSIMCLIYLVLKED